MLHTTDSSQIERPWGTYKLGRLGRLFQTLSGLMPTNWVGRRFALLFRKLALIGAGPLIDLESQGLRLRIARQGNVSDRKFAFMPQFVDPFERAEILSRLKPGGYFLDIGANAGVYSLCAAQRYAELGGGRVLAFEPNPQIAATLRRNIRFNGFEHIIEVMPFALSDSPGELEFFVDASNQGQSGFDRGLPDSPGHEGARRGALRAGERIAVPCRTLGDVLNGLGLHAADALKIDVEGAEDLVLAGFFRSAPDQQLPRCLVIENSESHWSIRLFDLFEARGLRLLKRTRMNSVFAA